MQIDQRITGFALPFVWGLVILASWIGWGEILSRILTGPKRDVGIRAGWGMCVMILFGGILNASNLCSVWTVGMLVGIGAVIFVANFIGSGGLHQQPNVPRGYWPLIALATLIYAGSVCWRFNWNAADDFIAYLVYPIKMLQSGAAHDPYSWRRLSTLGGYSFLEATVAIAGKPENTFLLDIGLGGILNCLLTVPLLRRTGASPLVSSLAGIICLTLPLGRVNSMSCILGMTGFFLLFRTVEHLNECPPSQRQRLCWVIGGIAAAITTIRPNFLAVVILALVLTELLWVIRGRHKALPACVDLGHMMLAGLICIAPWSIALHTATGSYFYPLFKGNQENTVDVFSVHLGTVATGKYVIGFLLRPKMLLLIVVGLVALGVSSAPTTAMWIAAFSGATLVVGRFTSLDYVTASRYTLPSLASVTVLAWISTQYEPAGALVAKLGRALLVGFAIALFVFGCVSHSGAIRSSLASLRVAVLQNEPFDGEREAPLYAAAQEHVPSGATVLTMVNYPFLLNYHRNTIYSADWPGMASPAPGMPLFQGGEVLAAYLRSQSIDYLMYVNFDGDEAIYSRKIYHPGGSNDMLVELTAPRARNMLQNVDDLAAISPVVFDQGGLRIIRIR